MQNEIFKDIPRYESSYRVSNFGNIKSLKCGKEIILKTRINTHGYYSVNLYLNGIPISHEIHTLVAKTFLNYIPNKGTIDVDHIDRNKLNNCTDNLRIVTHSENLLNRNNKNIPHPGISIYFAKDKNRWRASLCINNKRCHVGYFIDKNDALSISIKALHNFNEHNL